MPRHRSPIAPSRLPPDPAPLPELATAADLLPAARRVLRRALLEAGDTARARAEVERLERLAAEEAAMLAEAAAEAEAEVQAELDAAGAAIAAAAAGRLAAFLAGLEPPPLPVPSFPIPARFA